MIHPIAAITTRRELAELSRRVQYGEISWPQCYDRGKPIQLKDADGTEPSATDRHEAG